MVFPLINCTSELLEPKRVSGWCLEDECSSHVGLRGQCVISKVFD